MIRSGELADDEEVQRFRAEAEAAAQLHHPGIVPIYQIGVDRGQNFFSMAYIEGESLADRIRENPLPPKTAATYVMKVAPRGSLCAPAGHHPSRYQTCERASRFG